LFSTTDPLLRIVRYIHTPHAYSYSRNILLFREDETIFVLL